MAISPTAATVSPAATDQQDAHEEFHSKPVPLGSRLGFKEPALVWSGFGIAYICAVIGGLIQQGLGTRDAILAILLGNFILFLYSAAIGYANGKWGLNFPLTVKAVFGESGAILPILIMAVLVTGWYAFQAWLTADILRVALGIESGLAIGILAAIIAILMGLPVIFGIKWMANLMKLALPLMILFAAYYLFAKVIPAGSSLFSEAGTGKITFMTGVGMAWSTFVVSGTMTGDIVRYANNGRQAVWVTAVAFLFSNAPFMVLGALISAAINDPTVTYFLQPGLGLGLLVALVGIAILSNWSTCDACLYNATMGYANAIPGLTWRNAAIVGTVIGVVAAGTGIIGNIVDWLILLGLIVPPIGGAIIADYYVLRRGRGFGVVRNVKYNWAAIIAVLIGILVGYYVHVTYPTFLFGAAGIAASFIVYTLLAMAAATSLGAELSTASSGAEPAA
jgi:cytosine permease